MESTLELRPQPLRQFAVAVICIGLAAWCTHLLLQDINGTGDEGSGTPAATLERKQSKVRRKSAKSFVWNNTSHNQNFYRKDAIQTGPQSTALVKLKDGSLLELGENSLVVFDEASSMPFLFEKGNVVITRSDGTEAQLTATKKGPAQVQDFKIKLIEPKALAEIFIRPSEEKSLAFSWSKTSDPSTSPAFVEISSDRSFTKKKMKSYPVDEDNPGKLSIDLGQGRYFWRVSQGGQAISRIGQFQIIEATPAKLVFPVSQERITRFDESEGVKFLYKFLNTTHGTHRLELSSSGQFKNLIQNETIDPKSGEVTLGGLSDRTYFWRIRSTYGNTEFLSIPESFTLQKKADLNLTLVRPANDSEFKVGSETRFHWQSESGADSYRLELTDTRGKKVAEQELQTQTWSIKSLAVGTYQWKVTALRKKRAIGQSQVSRFEIHAGDALELIEPAMGKRFEYWRFPSTAEFKWKASSAEPGQLYMLEVAKDAGFTSVVTSERTNSSTLQAETDRFTATENDYYWRVKLVSLDGMVLRQSGVRKFKWTHFPPIAPPAEISPKDEKEYDVVHEGDPVLSWNKVENAHGYEITLYLEEKDGRKVASNNRKPYLKTVVAGNLSNPTLPLKKMKPGIYSWSISSVDEMDRRGPESESRKFKVSYGKVLQAPKNLSSEVQ